MLPQTLRKAKITDREAAAKCCTYERKHIRMSSKEKIRKKGCFKMRPKKAATGELPPLRPALSPEARENQMISLAMDLVEKRLREGTASSAETTHFLKLATVKSELEKAKLEEENKLLRAKTETLKAAKDNAELYKQAIRAMREYSGLDDEDEFDEN